MEEARMRKVICDSCGCEKAKNVFTFLHHLTHLSDVRGYVDEFGVATSSKQEFVDLCNRCYNEIVGRATFELMKRNPKIASGNKE
jgi:hypothetical protein